MPVEKGAGEGGTHVSSGISDVTPLYPCAGESYMLEHYTLRHVTSDTV